MRLVDASGFKCTAKHYKSWTNRNSGVGYNSLSVGVRPLDSQTKPAFLTFIIISLRSSNSVRSQCLKIYHDCFIPPILPHLIQRYITYVVDSYYVEMFRKTTILHTRGTQKIMQQVYFLGPILLVKNNILRAAAFKCPAFMHAVARFPAR
jgi:hypothetical protein